MRDNLKVPPWKLVLQWGRQLSMKPTDIKDVSEKLSLRHALGKIYPPPAATTLLPFVKRVFLSRAGSRTLVQQQVVEKNHTSFVSVAFLCPG